jgi:hypothetical protein
VFENSVLRRVLGLKIDEPIKDYNIFEVLSLTIKITAFWDEINKLINGYSHFGRIRCLHLQSHFYPQDGGITFP